MRVTFCTYDDPNFTGGPNSWLCRLLPDLCAVGIELKVIVFTDVDSPERCPAYQMLTEKGIECINLPFQAPTEQRIRWILSELAEYPTDIFVPNMLAAPFYASRWIKEAGIPTIGVLHSDDDFHRGTLQEFVFGSETYQFSALVCVSDFLKKHVVNLGKTTTQIYQIPYGVPITARQAHYANGNLKLIYVGRLEEEQKRISAVTIALCEVVRNIPNTEAIIYGEGSAKHEIAQILEERAKNLPIKLGGMIRNDRIQDVMLDAHILVLLSDYEGLPIALMEAMACGLVPICLSIRSGVSELVEDNVTGLLVRDRGDDFVSAVKKLRVQPELWTRLSIAARARIENSYSQKVCSGKWIDLLQELYELNSATKQAISPPNWLVLPPVNPKLAREDKRYLQQVFQSFKSKALFRIKSIVRKILIFNT